jgi:large-conductance mechanosensitive channel
MGNIFENILLIALGIVLGYAFKPLIDAWIGKIFP